MLLLYYRLMSTLAVTAKRVVVEIILHHIISVTPIIIAQISIPIPRLLFLHRYANKPIFIQQTLQTIILVTYCLTPFSLNL